MNFPDFGDAEGYLRLGQACYRGLQSGHAFEGCYQGLRPIGASAWFTLPYSLTQDAVHVAYAQLAMHVLAFLLLLKSMAVVMAAPVSQPARVSWVARAMLVLGGLALALPCIPVALADLPACAAFIAGVALLLRARGAGTAAMAGLSFAVACLVQQQYFVFTALAVGLFALVHVRSWDRSVTVRLVALCAGTLPALLQPYWIWLHTGHFYPYDPAFRAMLAAAHSLPGIETVTYSLPQHGTYLSSLGAGTTPRGSYVAIKLLQGFFAYRPAVYLGAMPADSPALVPLTPSLLVKAYAALLLVTGGHLWAAWRSPRLWRWLLLLSLGCTLFTAWYMHVENRFFLMPKLLILWWAAAWGLPVAAARLRASAASVGLLRPRFPATTAPGFEQDRVPWLALALYALVMVGCFLLFQHPDLAHTIGSSMAYLDGHWWDFYDYNKPFAERNDYLPAIYGVFALWLLPFKLAGHLTDVASIGSVMQVSVAELSWAKFLMAILFFVATWLLVRVGRLVGGSQKTGWRAAAVFATAPLGLFAVFLMGQYDIVPVVLMVAALYCYFLRRFWWFAVLFSLAIPFKYFALPFFVPLVLLAPVSWPRRVQLGLLGLAGTVLQFLAYAHSPAFRGNILDMVGSQTGAASGEFSHWMIMGLLGSALLNLLCLVPRERTDAQWHRAALLATCAAGAFMFLGIPWHPQWLLFALPFYALASLDLRRPAWWYVAEVVGTFAFIWLVAYRWPGNIDSLLVRVGTLRSYFPAIYMQLQDVLSPALLRPMEVLFTAHLFAPVVLLLVDGGVLGGQRRRVEADNWLAGRFFVSAAILLAPFLYTALASEAQGRAAGSQARFDTFRLSLAIESQSKPVGELTTGRVLRQDFVSPTRRLAGVGARFATYGREVEGVVRLTLLNDQGATIATDTVPGSSIKDNRFHSFEFPPQEDSKGQRYSLVVTTEAAPSGHAPTVWMDDTAATAGGALTLDGAALPGNLNLRVYFRP